VVTRIHFTAKNQKGSADECGTTPPVVCRRVVKKFRGENAYEFLYNSLANHRRGPRSTCLHRYIPNLQRGMSRRWQSPSQSAYDHFEEMVMATGRNEEHVQTMCRQAAAIGRERIKRKLLLRGEGHALTDGGKVECQDTFKVRLICIFF
jgi:hypothetical protein